MFKLYGMEDYRTVVLYDSLLKESTVERYNLSPNYCKGETFLLPCKEEEVENMSIVDHAELLDSAKTVYIHPSCALSRNIINQKYKKALNPWLADVVVTPPIEDELIPFGNNSFIFVNEDKKFAVVFITWDKAPYLTSTKKGTPLSEIVVKCLVEYILQNKNYYNVGYNLEDLFNSELDYIGAVYSIPKKDSYKIDLITKSIPLSKVVFESSILKSVGDENNAPTFENLSSLYEMLDSTDEEIVNAAMIALSCLDYANYPNCVRYVLWRTGKWKKCSVLNSTGVRFMLDFLGINRREIVRFQDSNIGYNDYELLTHLLSAYEKNYSVLSSMPFVYVDVNAQIKPRLMN